VDAVKEHLKTEEKNIYQPMLIHSDQSIKNTATQFCLAQWKSSASSRNTPENGVQEASFGLKTMICLLKTPKRSLNLFGIGLLMNLSIYTQRLR
jgi:hypothetical protein